MYCLAHTYPYVSVATVALEGLGCKLSRKKIATTNLCSENDMFASVHLIRQACKREESISVLEKIMCITIPLAEKKILI